MNLTQNSLDDPFMGTKEYYLYFYRYNFQIDYRYYNFCT